MEKKYTEFQDLGLRGYREVWGYQETLLEEVKKAKFEGLPVVHRLLLVEHPPVYTIGRSGNEANMLLSGLQLRARQAELIRVDRGGDITFHGPGQLVGYPVFDLESFGWGVREYVNNIEEVVIRTLRHYGINGARVAGAPGVWIDAGTPDERKICAIGVKCSRYVTMHGFALNVNTDLNYFSYIHPCGFVNKGVTSLEKETGRKIDMEDVKREVLVQFREVMGVEIIDKSK